MQKPRVGKHFYGSRKSHHAEVIGGLQQKIQAQPRRIGDDIRFNFRELPGALERGNAGFHLGLRVGFSGLLLDQRPKGAYVAMRICDEINRANRLPFIDGLRRLHCELCPCPNRKQQQKHSPQMHRPPISLSINSLPGLNQMPAGLRQVAGKCMIEWPHVYFESSPIKTP